MIITSSIDSLKNHQLFWIISCDLPILELSAWFIHGLSVWSTDSVQPFRRRPSIFKGNCPLIIRRPLRFQIESILPSVSTETFEGLPAVRGSFIEEHYFSLVASSPIRYLTVSLSVIHSSIVASSTIAARYPFIE